MTESSKNNRAVAVAIVYHSAFGHTQRVAAAAAEGVADVAGAQASLLDVTQLTDADWQTLDSADAIIFGSPTYMGTVSAAFKQFMDESSNRWFEQRWKNKLAAGFANSGSYSGDKLNVLTTLVIYACQHSMIWVGSDIMPPAPPEGEIYATPEQPNRLGGFVGAMSQSGDAPADVTPPQGDLLTARALGTRVSEFAKRLAAAS